MVWKSFSLSKVCLALYLHWAIHSWSGKVYSSLQLPCTYVLAIIQCHTGHRLLQFRSAQKLSVEMLHHWNVIKVAWLRFKHKILHKTLCWVESANNVVHNSPVDKTKAQVYYTHEITQISNWFSAEQVNSLFISDTHFPCVSFQLLTSTGQWFQCHM